MEFQEGVTFEEWFYNGILTNSSFILIIRLAHCSLSVFLLRQFVHSLTYFDRCQEPKTWNDKLFLVCFFETTCVALAPGTHCVNPAGFELSDPPASASCDIKALRHHLQLPGLFFNSTPMGLSSALHCGDMGLQSYSIVFEMWCLMEHSLEHVFCMAISVFPHVKWEFSTFV